MQIFSEKHQENNHNNNTKKPPKNTNKTKRSSGDKYLFFSCCKTDDVIMSTGRVVTPGLLEDDPVGKCVEMVEQDDVVLPRSVSAEVLVKEDQYGGGRHRKKDKKTITRVLKAVLFETSLAKKIKKRKLIQKLHKSNAKLEAKLVKGFKPKKRSGRTFSEGEDIFVKKFDTKNATIKKSKVHPLKSSKPSSVCSDLQTQSERTFDYNNPDDSKPKSDNVEEHGSVSRPGIGVRNCSSGLCLILLSLLVLVMWGKVCAIVCTSTWLFVIPRLGSWNIKPFRLMENSRKIDNDEEQKKKIIMEGLLQRKRNRGP